MKPTQHLFLVANRSRALLFKRVGLSDQISLVDSMECPEGRIARSETTTDRPGTVYSSSPGHANSYSSQSTPEDDIARSFASSLSERVERLEEDHQFDSLILVAEPRMLGILKSQLSKP